MDFVNHSKRCSFQTIISTASDPYKINFAQKYTEATARSTAQRVLEVYVSEIRGSKMQNAKIWKINAIKYGENRIQSVTLKNGHQC